jgi:hypothetical protein
MLSFKTTNSNITTILSHIKLRILKRFFPECCPPTTPAGGKEEGG